MAYQRIDEDPALKLHLRMVDTGAHVRADIIDRQGRRLREPFGFLLLNIVDKDFNESQNFIQPISQCHIRIDLYSGLEDNVDRLG